MNKNLILAIDTTKECLSVALADEKDVLSAIDEPMARGQSEALIPYIQKLFEKTHREPEELAAVLAAAGPGSFTGVRIGLAAARGLALALDVPLWGINGFDIMFAGFDKPCVAAIDTRRNDFYTQVFNAPGKEKPEILNANQITALNLPVLTDNPAVFSGMLVLPKPESAAQNMIFLYRTQKKCLCSPSAFYMREAETATLSKRG